MRLLLTGWLLCSAAVAGDKLAEDFLSSPENTKPTATIDVTGELEASADGTDFHSVCKLVVKRANLMSLSGKGPIMLAPMVTSFPAATGKVFRVKFSKPCAPVEITVYSAARIDRYLEKQLATMYEGSNPPYYYYTWPLKAEPERAELTVRKESVTVIQPTVDAAGELSWDPSSLGISVVTSEPAGNWVVQRIMAATNSGTAKCRQ